LEFPKMLASGSSPSSPNRAALTLAPPRGLAVVEVAVFTGAAPVNGSSSPNRLFLPRAAGAAAGEGAGVSLAAREAGAAVAATGAAAVVVAIAGTVAAGTESLSPNKPTVVFFVLLGAAAGVAGDGIVAAVVSLSPNVPPDFFMLLGAATGAILTGTAVAAAGGATTSVVMGWVAALAAGAGAGVDAVDAEAAAGARAGGRPILRRSSSSPNKLALAIFFTVDVAGARTDG